jgi:hypothetical protein
MICPFSEREGGGKYMQNVKKSERNRGHLQDFGVKVKLSLYLTN